MRGVVSVSGAQDSSEPSMAEIAARCDGAVCGKGVGSASAAGNRGREGNVCPVSGNHDRPTYRRHGDCIFPWDTMGRDLMPGKYTENELRLRALVRAAMSQGVWLLLGTQLLLQVISHLHVGDAADSQNVPVRLVVLGLLLLLHYYLLSGLSFALAEGRDTATLTQVLTGAKAVFPRFIWLIVKTGLISMLALNFILSFGLLVTGKEPDKLVAELIPLFPALSGILAFLFVYWLPWVFVTKRFLMFASLGAALRLLVAYRAKTGFLAALTILPPALISLLPESIPIAVLLGLAAIASFLGWVAYIYCVEGLRADAGTDG